jgi:hypothetical protein
MIVPGASEIKSTKCKVRREGMIPSLAVRRHLLAGAGTHALVKQKERKPKNMDMQDVSILPALLLSPGVHFLVVLTGNCKWL